MASSPNDQLKIVFGAMTFGKTGTRGARVNSLEDAAQMLDTFQKHGHNEIDTARLYASGTTEGMLAELKWQDRGLIMATKVFPNAGTALAIADTYTHSPEDLRRALTLSLKELQSESVDLYYLHGPDRKTPYEDTLREINKLHQEGKFARFGLSNFPAWEVAQICEVCEKHGWIKPAVYQGVYHALQRSIEPELMPCLRYYGMSLYAFQPLAGGFLTGRYTKDQTGFEPGSRFDPQAGQGPVHRARYWNDVYFESLGLLKSAAESHGMTLAQASLRWLKHHSMLKQDLGDAIIIGASNIKHLEENLSDLEQGPLPEDMLELFQEAWANCKGSAAKYHQ
ncbi:hypothetical protein BP6252_08243 [Coleophoma cylindrospora]|uniref:NADP-dependent oxidoreductase domain-containing protein n=1 Tax=Coleophoma cylindrospora TaxID=1849047 RepID=A0A3D8R5B0_9HELO|nr:hypothetical protein BP6252_08243 [Coleophoma cylindrospora]